MERILLVSETDHRQLDIGSFFLNEACEYFLDNNIETTILTDKRKFGDSEIKVTTDINAVKDNYDLILVFGIKSKLTSLAGLKKVNSKKIVITDEYQESVLFKEISNNSYKLINIMDSPCIYRINTLQEARGSFKESQTKDKTVVTSIVNSKEEYLLIKEVSEISSKNIMFYLFHYSGDIYEDTDNIKNMNFSDLYELENAINVSVFYIESKSLFSDYINLKSYLNKTIVLSNYNNEACGNKNIYYKDKLELSDMINKRSIDREMIKDNYETTKSNLGLESFFNKNLLL